MSKLTVTLNDREMARIAAVKNYLGYTDQQALGLIIAACDRRAIQRAMLILKPPAPKVVEQSEDDVELII
jgi:hypothetical protein